MRMEPPAVDPRARNWLWRSFQLLFQALFVFGFRYRVRGRENLPEGGALLLMNHQSFLDPLVAALSFQRPVSYLARHDLFTVPVIGRILKNTYVIPIRRDSAATESLRLATQRLQQGYYVGIFPEGTRSSDGKMRTIKPGFLAIVRRAGVPVVPIGIAGSGAAYPRGAWFVKPRPIRVVIGEALSAEQVMELSKKGREAEFLTLVQDRMQAALTEANAWLEQAIDVGEPEPINGMSSH